MATHLLVWQQSVSNAGLTALNNAPSESVVVRPDSLRYYVPPGYNHVHWAAALGSILTRAQLISPSIQRRRLQPEIAPIVGSGDSFAVTKFGVYIPVKPIPLDVGEALELDAQQSGVAANNIAGVLIGPAVLPPVPEGDIRILRGTATATLTANAWTIVTLTMDAPVEAGQYALIGFVAISAGCQFARAVPQGAGGLRPGLPGVALATTAAIDYDPAVYNKLMYYDMLHFQHNAIPQFEFFANAANTAETVILYVVKLP